MSSVNEPLSQPPPPDPEEQAQAIGGADETDHHVQVDNTQDLDPDKRVRKPNEKGLEMYESKRAEHWSRLQKGWERIVNLIDTIKTCAGDMKLLRQVDKALKDDFAVYRSQQIDLLNFFKCTNSPESISDLEKHVQTMQHHEQDYGRALSNIATLKREVIETMSHFSGSSLKSRHSSRGTSVIALKCAKADAARAQVAFTEKEALILKQKAFLAEQERMQAASTSRKTAELEADLRVLSKHREAAAAEAEANALKFANEDRGFPLDEFGKDQHVDSAERTRAYVVEQSQYVHNEKVEPIATGKAGLYAQDNLMYNPVVIASPFQTLPTPHMLSAKAAEFNPVQTPNVTPHDNEATPVPRDPCPVSQQEAATAEFTRFLLKKELLLSRLSNFNDKPETYTVWKASFKSIMTELKVTPFEEMDLLVKWLGPESARNALSIRASNPNDPTQGLKRIWDRLEERYGCPEMVESALKQKLANFPKLTNKDNRKLYELSDILSEIEATKQDKKYQTLLAYFDSSSGINPIVCKLPYGLQEKWTTRAVNYKRQNDAAFPPFSIFADFIRDMSRVKNDPGLTYESPSVLPSRERLPPRNLGSRPTVSVKKTELSTPSEQGPDKICPIHNTGHTLNKCRGFKAKTLADRRKFLKERNICFKCCMSNKHRRRDCTANVQCEECGSKSHASAMHAADQTEAKTPVRPVESHGGEHIETPGGLSSSITAKCTQICHEPFGGKSCAKTVLVNVYPDGLPDKAKRMYAMIDDQSNRSLARSDFFTFFNVPDDQTEYTISSCTGNLTVSGRHASGFTIESLDGCTQLQLPTLIECDYMPNAREEIPTPEVARNYAHFHDIVQYIPSIDPAADILLLIGRDLIEAHHVLDQKIGPRNSPYAQKLSLGWVIIGETCLGKMHRPDAINVKKTYVLEDGRESIFKPCGNEFLIQECVSKEDKIGATVFQRTKADDKPGLSIEDVEFFKVMDKEFTKGPLGNWVAPLPFRSSRPRLPNNKPLALKRAESLHISLQKNPVKRDHFVTFMKKILDSGHAEVAPPLCIGEEHWYLPLFGVYHPKKPGQIRGVFDSSAQFDGVSLNKVLLSGPDLTNNLLGVLMRFRREPVAITADIEQMFHCFHVREDHRNFLRFLWYKDNNPDKELIEYRMTVHVFGNSPSPAVATYGLHRTAAESADQFGSDVKRFVESDFYVDDGISSLPSVEDAINLLRRTKEALMVNGSLRLHKIASNREEVLKAFPEAELSKSLKGLNFQNDDLPLQHSLGLSWDLRSDCFTFQSPTDVKPFTRRGVLSVVNSLFDPLGFVAPVTIQGKLFLREFLSITTDWDEPLPKERLSDWESWKSSLKHLEELRIPRTYSSLSFSQATEKEVHIFSDASEQVIAAVAYLKISPKEGPSEVGFILGKAKVAPFHGHTIPRLELCGAVLAVELAEVIEDHLGLPTDKMHFYTDSKVVLGYIYNASKRFYVYVANRVQRIRKSTNPDQWSYVASDKNPADSATRPAPMVNMQGHRWLQGPSHLFDACSTQAEGYPLTDPDNDKEVRPLVRVSKIEVTITEALGSYRFERFSVWNDLIDTIAFLRHICSSFQGIGENVCRGWHKCTEYKNVRTLSEAEQFIIRTVQREVYSEEISLVNQKLSLPRNNPLLPLNPIMDEKGLLRVGGRLNQSSLSQKDKNPIIIPGNHHIAVLLARHYHILVKHQGRHLTEGAVRSAGFWITGGKRLISSVIHKCVKCRKLRGRYETQKMADLPSVRLEPSPPFTAVGVDAFGPWLIVSRRTRGGLA